MTLKTKRGKSVNIFTKDASRLHEVAAAGDVIQLTQVKSCEEPRNFAWLRGIKEGHYNLACKVLRCWEVKRISMLDLCFRWY
jgi:hypothetical protein